MPILQSSICISDVSSMFGEVAKSRNINFHIKVDEQTLKTIISTDNQRLIQILRNLLSNAFKFTEPGQNVTLLVQKEFTLATAFKNKKA